MLLLSCSALLVFIASVLADDPIPCKSVKNRPGCVCQTEDGSYISLLNFANEDKSPSLTASDGDFKYFYNPCYGVSMDVESGSCTGSDEMASCQQNNDQTEAYGIGSITTETIFRDKNGSFYITYTDGQDNRHSEVYLICDESAKAPEFTTEGDKNHPGDYVFQLKSNEVCTTQSLPSQDGTKTAESAIGWVGLVIILLAVLGIAAYFVVGTLVNKFAFKRTGTEIIPQKNFWKSVPFLIKDGVLFISYPILRRVKKDYHPLA